MKSVLGNAVLAAAVVLPMSAFAQTVEEFYGRNDIRLLVGYGVGGGYDVYARVLARHIGKHLPGHPNVIVENMPGAGSLTMANYLVTAAPRDGTVLGTIGRGLPFELLLGLSQVEFDINELTWIGSMSDEVSVCMIHASVDVESLEDIVTGGRSVTMGSVPGGDSEHFPRLVQNLAGADIDLVVGYSSITEVSTAVERGEVDGQCGSLSVIGSYGDWGEPGRIKLLVQLANTPAEGHEDVPLLSSFVTDPEDREVLDLIISRNEAAYPFVAPPGLPEDRLEALRTAFLDALSDPELLAEFEQMNRPVNPMDAETLGGHIARLYGASDPIVDRARQVIGAD